MSLFGHQVEPSRFWPASPADSLYLPGRGCWLLVAPYLQTRPGKDLAWAGARMRTTWDQQNAPPPFACQRPEITWSRRLSKALSLSNGLKLSQERWSSARYFITNVAWALQCPESTWSLVVSLNSSSILLWLNWKLTLVSRASFKPQNDHLLRPHPHIFFSFTSSFLLPIYCRCCRSQVLSSARPLTKNFFS